MDYLEHVKIKTNKTLSKDFYEKALGSAGLTKEQSKNMAKEMIGWFDKDPENVSDLMNIKSVQDSFDLSTIDNSGFNNPAIVKTPNCKLHEISKPNQWNIEYVESFAGN